MPSPEFARPSEEPQRKRPELRIVPSLDEQEIEEAQIVEARDMTPLEMAQARVTDLRAKLAEAENQLKIEETREIVGNEGAPIEKEWFAQGDKPEELVN